MERFFICWAVASLLQLYTNGLQCQFGLETNLIPFSNIKKVFTTDCSKACCIISLRYKYEKSSPILAVNQTNQFSCGYSEVAFNFNQAAIYLAPARPSGEGTFCCCSKSDNCNVDINTCKNNGAIAVSKPPPNIAPEVTIPDLKCKIGRDSSKLEMGNLACDGICCLTKTSSQTLGGTSVSPMATYSCNKFWNTAFEKRLGVEEACCCTSEDEVCNYNYDTCTGANGTIVSYKKAVQVTPAVQVTSSSTSRSTRKVQYTNSLTIILLFCLILAATIE